ncbi:MAG: SDR family oxidoreductase [Kiritimatiellae bacterium]|nr:SDR family oxidoreductase [Kiritimatiellia bacterium]
MEFAEMTALVTGGATGIGFGCVKALIRKGCRVAINSRNEEKLETAARTLKEAGLATDSNMMTVSADVTDSGAVKRMYEQIADTWGPVNALVNNAAISGGRKKLAEIAEDEWDRMMHANLRGLYLCTREALAHMYERKWGRIVNISSIAGVSGKLLASPHYAATKGGIAAFTKRLAIEAAPYNVAVNGVAPGLIADTGFTHMIQGDLLEQYLAGIPANRPGTCEETGELVAFLCSEHAGYIIGQTILIDGGAST